VGIFDREWRNRHTRRGERCVGNGVWEEEGREGGRMMTTPGRGWVGEERTGRGTLCKARGGLRRHGGDGQSPGGA
jgi:hypothetical protein